MFNTRLVTPIHVRTAKGNDKTVKLVSMVPSVAVNNTEEIYAYIARAAMNPITAAIIFFFE
jgi:hypothetical protein